MKTVPLSNDDRLILVDDDDFPEVSKYVWRVSFDKRTKREIIQASDYDRRHGHVWIFPGNILFPYLHTHGYRCVYKDGNIFNWQRENIQFFAGKTGQAIDANNHLIVPWCPFGPAVIKADRNYRKEAQRPELCTQCPDGYQEPYWHCLDYARRAGWPGWRREENDR